VASLFALGSTNYLSVTTNITVTDLPNTSFLKLALPQDISHFQNLNDLTTIQLRLVEPERLPYEYRRATLVLRCYTADREVLHTHLDYFLTNSRHLDEIGEGIMPERPPAMRVLNCLRPLDLKKVEELRMEGFVGMWGLQSFELGHFLQQTPVLKRIVTGDGNEEIFSLALGAARLGTSVTVEGV